MGRAWKETILLLATFMFAVDRLGQILNFLAGAQWVHERIVGWHEFVASVSQYVSDGLYSLSGLRVSDPFEPLLPLVLQLLVVVAIAFWRFGFEPFFTRAAKALGTRGMLIHYIPHLAATILLLMIVMDSSGISLLSTGQGFLFGGFALSAPANALDLTLSYLFAAIILVMVAWHPGIAIRILGAGIIIVSISSIVAQMFPTPL